MKKRIYQFLNWLSKYTQTDMIYVVGGSFWWIFGRVFSFLAGFFILIAFAKFASKEVFGAYQYVISMVTTISVLSLSGIDAALVRAVAQGKEKTFLTCSKEKMKWGSLASLVCFLISGWYFFHQNFLLGMSFLIGGLFLPFLYSFNLYLFFWQGKKRFDLQNKYLIFHNFLAAAILIPIVIFKPEIHWVIFGYYFGFTLATFFFWNLTKKIAEKSDKEDRETISFGKHLTLMNLPGIVASQFDKIILWQFLGPVSLAIYAFSLRPVERISELIPFSIIAFPKMAEKDLTQSTIKKRIFDKFLKLFWVVIPFILLYILFCPLFFKIFFPAYKDSIIYSQILAFVLLFSPFTFLSTVFLAQMKKRELYILSFAPQILKIVLLLVLIPLFKIWGGVSSILISQAFSSFLILYFFKKF